MSLVLRSLPQMLVTAAVVTTALFGVALHSFVSFADAFTAYQGLAAWWAVVFVPALVYSAYMMPWRGRD